MTALYDDLDVSPDATAAELKAAHRKAARKHHPDAGGDRDDFERIQRAAVVLCDPARRAKYDATGDTDTEPDNKASQIASMMNAALNHALDRARGDFEHCDLVAFMRDYALEQLNGIRAEISKGKDARARIAKMMERVTYKGGGNNLLAGILKDRKQDLDQQIERLGDSADGFDQLAHALEQYGWQVDERDQLDIEAFLGGHAKDPGWRFRAAGVD